MAQGTLPLLSEDSLFDSNGPGAALNLHIHRM